MANKKIGDLQLRSDFADTVSFPVDDALQTWRVTGAQIRAGLLDDDSIALNMIPDGLITADKLAVGAIARSNYAAKTANYTLVASDNIIAVNGTAGAFTLTLPTAVGIAGKRYVIHRTDNTPANAVTIDGAGSETVGGSATKALYTKGETWEIMSDGSNWIVINHKCDTPFETDAGFSIAGGGTITNMSIQKRRVGDSLEVRGVFTIGTPAASTAAILLPTGFVIDSAKLTSQTNAQRLGTWDQILGGPGNINTDVASALSPIFYDGSTTDRLFFSRQYSSNEYPKTNGSDFWGSTAKLVIYNLVIPIANWDA